MLETTILVRSHQAKLFARFPLFYCYIACVLSFDVVRFFCYRLQPESYPHLYWYTESFSILAGYGVIYEIYRSSLRNSPGVTRIAKRLLRAVLVVTLVEVTLDTFRGPHTSLAGAIARFGRDLRYVELSLWIAMLAFFAFYRVPVGRNLRGLVVGYGLFLSASVVNLAVVFQPGNRLVPVARQLPIAAYLTALMIWCAALWSAYPEPVPPFENQMERDYQRLAARTESLLARIRGNLSRSIRP